MLAYVFWHRPAAAADASAYEDAQRTFHAALDVPSSSFRIDRLPFAEEDGYEDWYLVDDWATLGKLNESAVDNVRRNLSTLWRLTPPYTDGKSPELGTGAGDRHVYAGAAKGHALGNQVAFLARPLG